mgnify:CR=1
TQFPNICLTRRNVVGLAITKNSNADINAIRNFFSCFLPLQPHPQSLNIKLFLSPEHAMIFIIHLEKKSNLKFDD